MEKVLEVILALSFMLFFYLLAGWLIGWRMYIKRVKKNNSKYGLGSYKDFKKEFNKYNWNWSYEKPEVIYDNSSNSKIEHAAYNSTIQFNNIGMVLNLIDYLRMRFFIRQYIKNSFKSKRKMYDWANIKEE